MGSEKKLVGKNSSTKSSPGIGLGSDMNGLSRIEVGLGGEKCVRGIKLAVSMQIRLWRITIVGLQQAEYQSGHVDSRNGLDPQGQKRRRDGRKHSVVY